MKTKQSKFAVTCIPRSFNGALLVRKQKYSKRVFTFNLDSLPYYYNVYSRLTIAASERIRPSP